MQDRLKKPITNGIYLEVEGGYGYQVRLDETGKSYQIKGAWDSQYVPLTPDLAGNLVRIEKPTTLEMFLGNIRRNSEGVSLQNFCIALVEEGRRQGIGTNPRQLKRPTPEQNNRIRAALTGLIQITTSQREKYNSGQKTELKT